METYTLMKNKQKNNAILLVLLRHGESLWNKENLFCGWTDIDLSDRGRKEVLQSVANQSLTKH